MTRMRLQHSPAWGSRTLICSALTISVDRYSDSFPQCLFEHPLLFGPSLVISPGIVANTNVLFINANLLDATWRQKIDLMSHAALNTQLYDVAIDVPRHFYTRGTYTTADGAGNALFKDHGLGAQNWIPYQGG